MQLGCTGRESSCMGMGPTWLGRRQALDQEPGLGHAPGWKFRDSDHFRCDLVCQPGVSLLLPGLDRVEGRKPSRHTERGPPLSSCSTDIRPRPALVPEAVGGQWRFKRRKDCPTRPPCLGKSLMQQRHVRCRGTVCTGPHSISVRWRSMLPRYRGENGLRAGKRLTQSHSQSAKRNGCGHVWGSFPSRKQLLQVPGQVLGWDCFQISTLSPAIHAHCASSRVAQKRTVPNLFEAGVALAEVWTSILGLTE